MPCFITSGTCSQNEAVNGCAAVQAAGRREVGGIVAGEAQRLADLARHQRVGRRRGAGLLVAGQVGELVVRLQSIERIVARPARAGRALVGAGPARRWKAVSRDFSTSRSCASSASTSLRQAARVRSWSARRQRQRRRGPEGGAVVGAPLVDAVEEGAEPVVVLHRAAGRTCGRGSGVHSSGQTEEGGAEGLDAVGDVLVAPLLGDAAALVGHAVQPAEGGGQALRPRRAGQQVAGELPGDELVERQVVVEGGIDPVAPRPDVCCRRRPGSRTSRRSGRRRASPGPAARRSAARPAAGPTTRSKAARRVVGEEGVHLGRASAAGRSGRR